jgi:hypothetical protein
MCTCQEIANTAQWQRLESGYTKRGTSATTTNVTEGCVTCTKACQRKSARAC